MKTVASVPSAPRLEDFTQIAITRKIAEGGMGAVYEAQQRGAEGFEKTVAIKIMLSKLTQKQFSELFVAEAKLVANLVHENIVQIYQLGRTPAGYYIVMEYVNGISLASFISYHRTLNIPLPEPLAVFITSRIARGLAYAHKRTDAAGNPLGIVHRDVCPSNIMITTEGLPKLGDFGVAKVTKSVLSRESVFVGKLIYMAPEQARQQPVDFRADIFSLGAVLFELLARRPIRAPARNTTMAQAPALVKTPIPWALLPRATSKDLRTILRKMLAMQTAHRYQDTDQLAHDLEYFIYRDGYGPTIQTLENYLRKHFNYLYLLKETRGDHQINDLTTVLRSARRAPRPPPSTGDTTTAIPHAASIAILPPPVRGARV